jgi:hypothetical protein
MRKNDLPKIEIHLPKKQKGLHAEACNPLFLLRILWGG